MSEDHLDLVRQVLDKQIVDANQIPCGKVDDLEIEGKGKLKITALLVGNGVASKRLPEVATFISQKIFGKRIVKIPWSEVSIVSDKITLKSPAGELNLDERQGWIFNFISKLPGAWKK